MTPSKTSLNKKFLKDRDLREALTECLTVITQITVNIDFSVWEIGTQRSRKEKTAIDRRRDIA